MPTRLLTPHWQIDKGWIMYRIGELAQLFELKTDTLRFYEKHGLLSPSSRTDSGYRIYTQSDAERLRFIVRAKGVGFTLADIAELLSIELDKSNWACADVKGLVDDKLANVEAKIAELNHFQLSLQRLSQACCGGPESAEHCSILEALESSDDNIEREQHQAQNHAAANQSGRQYLQRK